jgi:hypothetical protein
MVVYDTTALATGMNGLAFIGAPDWNTLGAGCSSTALSGPTAVAYDAVTGNLFVVDASNNRVLLYSMGP